MNSNHVSHSHAQGSISRKNLLCESQDSPHPHTCSLPAVESNRIVNNSVINTQLARTHTCTRRVTRRMPSEPGLTHMSLLLILPMHPCLWKRGRRTALIQSLSSLQIEMRWMRRRWARERERGGVKKARKSVWEESVFVNLICFSRWCKMYTLCQ